MKNIYILSYVERGTTNQKFNKYFTSLKKVKQHLKQDNATLERINDHLWSVEDYANDSFTFQAWTVEKATVN